MIKYFCDGCGDEVSPETRRLHGLLIQSTANGHLLDELVLCKPCNKSVIEEIKKLTPFRDE